MSKIINGVASEFEIPTTVSMEDYNKLYVEDTKRLIEKDKEIEKLNNELNLYKDNHEYLNNQLQQKENIIKEVREYVEHKASIRECYMINGKEYKELLEILDKGE